MHLRKHDLVMREIDGETVLLDLAGAMYFAVNGTGTFLLRLLGSDQDRSSLVAALVAEFGVSEQMAAADAEAFLAVLLDEGLLVERSPHQGERVPLLASHTSAAGRTGVSSPTGQL